MTTKEVLLFSIPLTIALFAQVFRKYLDGIFPDHVKFAKGINGFLVKSLKFTINYLVPIGAIVWYMVKTTVVDKWFVLDICILMATLLNNFLLALIKIHADIARMRFEILKQGVDSHEESVIFLAGKVGDISGRIGIKD